MGCLRSCVSLLLMGTLCLKAVHAASKLDIKLIHYKSNGRDAAGDCCDEFCRACDPKFTICFKYKDWSSADNGECQQTGHFHKRNDIWFETSIMGVTNPFVKNIDFGPAPRRVEVDIKVIDDDTFWDDLLGDVRTAITDIRVDKNPSATNYRYITVTYPNSHNPKTVVEIQLGIRVYCNWNWYGQECLKHCKEDEGEGHYTCDEDTGAKICKPGYEGSYCHIDIDECKKGMCQNGTCTNFDGGFKCECHEGYKGDQCDEAEHKCVENPCKNGGTCYLNGTAFICECRLGFGGSTCEETVGPCDELPCQNAGTCIPDNTTFNFTCACGDGWTGTMCEDGIIPTTLPPIMFGDPSTITLLGVVNDTNRDELRTGLMKLVNILGNVPGEVYIDLTTRQYTADELGETLTLTNVTFSAGQRGKMVDKKDVDEIFTKYSNDRINPFLPLPLYVPTKGPDRITGGPDHHPSDLLWPKIVFPILALIVIIIIIVAVILLRKRRKEKQKQLEAGVQEGYTNISFENVLYNANNQANQQRQDEVSETNPPARDLPNGIPNGTACAASEENPYMNPETQYDTPLKRAFTNSAGQYENSNVASLDTRQDAGINDYTDFSDLDGAKNKEDNPYAELDEIMEEKARIAAMEARPDTPLEETDEEDDIDKIKASFRKDQSEV